MSRFRRVTLATDFGPSSWYVAAMKGALLTVAPQATIIDLTHDLPPQDIPAAAFFLQQTLPYFPADTLHVAVVDPGVGSDRAILFADWPAGAILAPDNGVWASLRDVWGEPRHLLKLDRPELWRSAVSATFHGRDIFAPTAGHLLNGIEPSAIGSVINRCQRIALPRPERTANGWLGEVLALDRYGNIVSNITVGEWDRVWLGKRTIAHRVRTYADAAPGDLVTLIGSHGLLEIAVVRGSAASELGAHRGQPIRVELPTPLLRDAESVQQPE